ncbi:hypothetical protein CROQUDRAFT_50606, partial [Cronartium quercuum f. sp. fusiforme G11]
ASGIIIQHLDNNNKTYFATDEHSINPKALWKAIHQKYASKEEHTQPAVFSSFIHIPFSSLSDFVNETRSALNEMTSVGCDINTKYLAEIIVSKLPDSMNTTVQSLHKKCPLSIKSVLDTLDNHILDQAMPSHFRRNQLHLLSFIAKMEDTMN